MGTLTAVSFARIMSAVLTGPQSDEPSAYWIHSVSEPVPLVTCVRESPVRRESKIRRPELPVSKRMSLIVRQVDVPGEHTVTLTQGLLGYDPLEHSEPFTVKVITLFIGVIVRSAEPEMLPEVAVTVVAPAVSVVTRPQYPAVLLMIATAGEDELQFTEVVITLVVLSENVPVAMNCWVLPSAMPGFIGVTAIERSTAGDVPDAPVLEPPPPHAVTSKKMMIEKSHLLDRIDTHSLRYQVWHIGAALQIAHMSPFLYNDAVCFYLDVPVARLSWSLAQDFSIFGMIGSQKGCEVRMGQPAPCNTEYNAGW
jgi:hypothetical protein